MSSHHVVIIGSGFGAIFAARKLKRTDCTITIIARTGHHLFQPLLYQLATGILSEGEIAPATREILRKNKNTKVILGLVEDIDPETKTVYWRNHKRSMTTQYDTLIVAAGAGQSYFGNDHFSRYAPGMKTVDDALELRARILGAFELAELETDPSQIEKLLTFVVVGAGPTGVEVAGQIRELASKTLRRDFRSIDPASARVILVDGAPLPLPVFGQKLSGEAARSLTKLGVELKMGSLVTDIDDSTVTIKHEDGSTEVIPSICKVWAAGIQASPLGAVLADRTGVELDRSGRVKVNSDLSVGRHDDVFVVGDLMCVEGVPGVAQGAIQSARFVASIIKDRILGKPTKGRIFKYKDKGSMATISKFNAVASVGKFQFHGFFAWVMWCFLHLLYIVGFKSQIGVLLHWFVSFLSSSRAEKTFTNQQMVGRVALEELGEGASGDLMIGKVLRS